MSSGIPLSVGYDSLSQTTGIHPVEFQSVEIVAVEDRAVGLGFCFYSKGIESTLLSSTQP